MAIKLILKGLSTVMVVLLFFVISNFPNLIQEAAAVPNPSCAISQTVAQYGTDIAVEGEDGESNPFNGPVLKIFLHPVFSGAADIEVGEMTQVGSGKWIGKFEIPQGLYTEDEYEVVVVDTNGVRTTCGTRSNPHSPAQIAVVDKFDTVGKDNPCQGHVCNTALGDVSTNPQHLAQAVLNLAIGIGGGLTLILMVIGSVRVLTSSGDPQRVGGGRDMIVAALAGMLFIIFSTVILRFLGVHVLGL